MARAELYRAYDVAEHLVHSAAVGDTFKIKVLRPISHVDGSERFPVLYCTDSDYFFGGLANLSSLLQVSGEASPFILVGIGYDDARTLGE